MRTRDKSNYELFVADGTRIAKYGTITVCLDLSLRRIFKWRVVVADAYAYYDAWCATPYHHDARTPRPR